MKNIRVKAMNNKPRNMNGKYVLYWMQQSHRFEYNHALSFAINEANNLGVPIVVCFGLCTYPEANERHYFFMLEGLKELSQKLKNNGIKFVLKLQNPVKVCLDLSQDAVLTVVDRGYLKLQKKWRSDLVDKIEYSLFEVETDLIVPIELASDKEEYAAYTIRKKIHRNLDDFLIDFEMPIVKFSGTELSIESEELSTISNLIDKLDIDRIVEKSKFITGGYSNANKLLEKFIENKLDDYVKLKNDPTFDYNSDYDNIKGLKADWINKTIEEHRDDSRDFLYTFDQWEKAETHDDIWNACQKELVLTGEMHGYMRMYWGKKILEWSESVEQAFDIAVYLNNKYAIDGRDANSYTGIAWCFGKHDRSWFERNVFGKIRYMNANGIKRKFKIEKYVEAINEKLIQK